MPTPALKLFREQFAAIGNRLFVFKWKNPEQWLSPIIGRGWRGYALADLEQCLLNPVDPDHGFG